ENTRLFKELEQRNRDLTESLEQQTATSEILRVTSQSQRDVQPVFETIASNARKLCRATAASVFTFNRGVIELAANESVSPQMLEGLRQIFPMRLSADARGATAQAILARSVVHFPDVLHDAGYGLTDLAQQALYRSIVSIPMLREGVPIGAITISSAEPAMFS